MVRALVVAASGAIAAAGCNALLGIDDPQDQPVDASAPDQSSSFDRAAAGAADAPSEATALADGTADAPREALPGAALDAREATSPVDAPSADRGCPGGFLSCDGGCLSPTDPRHCGACGRDCAALAHVADSGLACSGGRCLYACLPGYADCDDSGGGCAADLSQASSCGGCGAPHVCSSAMSCADGGCKCPEGAHDCGGVCKSNGALDSCGSACTTVCPGPTNGAPYGTATCDGISCGLSCAPGLSPCSGACVDLQTDNANCGGCGAPCTGTCSGGACVPAYGGGA